MIAKALITTVMIGVFLFDIHLVKTRYRTRGWGDPFENGMQAILVLLFIAAAITSFLLLYWRYV